LVLLSYELPPSSDGGADPARKASAEKKKMQNSASLQLKLFGSEPLFFISAQAVERQPDLRLKPEAIHKKTEAFIRGKT
jgi:hypothetical protein